MNALNVILEDFEAVGAELTTQHAAREEPQSGSTDYAEGFAAGQAAALLGAKEDTNYLRAMAGRVEDALNDTNGQLTSQFCEALKMAVEKVFPSIANKAFADAAVMAVTNAMKVTTDEKVTLFVSASRKEMISDALGHHGVEDRIAVEVDPSLSEMCARAECKNTGLEIDYESAIDQCLIALEEAIIQMRGGGER